MGLDYLTIFRGAKNSDCPHADSVESVERVQIGAIDANDTNGTDINLEKTFPPRRDGHQNNGCDYGVEKALRKQRSARPEKHPDDDIVDSSTPKPIWERARADMAKWNAEDWGVSFEERAAIAVHDGGLPRHAAEAQAFQCSITDWMNKNPPPSSDPERCAQCDQPMTSHEALPFLTGGGGHVWLHGRCHDDWMERRRAAAIEALAALGITAPVPTGSGDE